LAFWRRFRRQNDHMPSGEPWRQGDFDRRPSRVNASSPDKGKVFSYRPLLQMRWPDDAERRYMASHLSGVMRPISTMISLPLPCTVIGPLL
jgi:hypothetical protein